MMDAWLAEHLESLVLTPECEEYLLSRGVREDVIPKLGFKTWRPAPTEAPDTGVFKDRYSGNGQNLNGWLIVPIYCPRGLLLGFEGRRFPDKKITRYLLGRAEWNPVWYGIVLAMDALWEGKSPWICEGYFDVEVMRLVLPNEPLLGSFRAKLTDKHVEFLRRILAPGSAVNLVYDNDETGKTGIKKARYVLDQAGLVCRPIPFNKGKDPNEVWEQFGTGGLRQAFNL